MKKIERPLGITSSLRIQLRDESGKETVELRKEGQVEKRISRKAGKAIWIVYKAGNIVHIHCKDKDCGNEWKIKEGATWTEKFEVKGTAIKCLKCGKVHESG